MYFLSIFSPHFSLSARSWQLAQRQIRSFALCSLDMCQGMMCARSSGQGVPQTAHRCPDSNRISLVISAGIEGLSDIPSPFLSRPKSYANSQTLKSPYRRCPADTVTAQGAGLPRTEGIIRPYSRLVMANDQVIVQFTASGQNLAPAWGHNKARGHQVDALSAHGVDVTLNGVVVNNCGLADVKGAHVRNRLAPPINHSHSPGQAVVLG